MSKGNSKKEDDDLLKFLKLYEEKSKNFTRTFGILLGVAVFFLFFIFIPYITILNNKYEISQDLKDIQQILNNFTDIQNAIGELQSKLYHDRDVMRTFFVNIINNYVENRNNCLDNAKAIQLIQISEAEIGYVKTQWKDNSFWSFDVCNKLGVVQPPKFNTNLHFYLDNVTDPVKKYLPFISYSYNGTHRLEPESDPLNKTEISLLEYYNSSWHIGSKFWLDQTNKNKIRPLFVEYYGFIDKINNDTSQQLTTTRSLKFENSSTNEGFNELRNSLNKLRAKYTEITPIVYDALKLIIENRTTDVEKVLNDRYIPEITNELNKTNPIFVDMRRTIELHLEGYQKIEDSLNENITGLQIKENEISERLKDMEFPFGKIPIGTNEAISFFPVGLGVGFLISTSLLTGAISLRKNYHEGRLKKTGHRKEMDEKITLIAPLWIDPIAPIPCQIIRFVILLIPLIIFGVSFYLLSQSWGIIYPDQDLTGVFIGNNRDNIILYIALYILSLGFFFYGSWKIVYVIKNYRDSFLGSQNFPKADV